MLGFLLAKTNRIVSFIGILLALPIFAICQLQVGLGSGISYNSLAASPINRPLTSYHNLTGYTVSIVLQYPLNPFISIGLEPTFIKKNYKTVRNGYYQGVYQATYNSYIQLPALLTFSVRHKTLSGGVSIGGYSAYWARSKKKGEIPNLSNLSFQDDNYTNVFQNIQRFSYSETYRFDPEFDRRWEFGWAAGLDLRYTIDEQLAVFIAPRYYYSLSGQVKGQSPYQDQRFNGTWVMGAGLLLKVNWLHQTQY